MTKCYKMSFMEAFEIGKFIKEFRERKNISQEDLSENLCAVSTLSRIERGVQYPSRTLLEAFFSRLGVSNTNIQLPLSSPDFKRSVLEYEIINKASRTEPDFVDLLDEYKQVKDEMDILEEQFYIFFMAMNKTITKSVSNEQILKEFYDAIHITLKDFSICDNISNHLLTKTELLILLNIARTEYFMGNSDKAIYLMEQLEQYYDSHTVSGEDLAANLPGILFNLSNWYGKKEEYRKALEKADKGIGICSEYGKLHILPYLIYNKGYSYLVLNETEKGQNIVTTSINLLIQLGKTDDARFGIKYIKDTLNIEIPEIL